MFSSFKQAKNILRFFCFGFLRKEQKQRAIRRKTSLIFFLMGVFSFSFCVCVCFYLFFFLILFFLKKVFVCAYALFLSFSFFPIFPIHLFKSIFFSSFFSLMFS